MMRNGAPEYVDYEELLELLHRQAQLLPPVELGWWQTHRVEPFAAQWEEQWHFVVAREAKQVLFFADDEDEFGSGSLEQDYVLEDYLLIGDLTDAIHWFLQPPA
jgi:hypothetical protein